MTINFKTSTFIAGGLLVVLLLFMLFKSCQPQPVTVERKQYDSLLQVNKDIDSVYQESLYRDSLLVTQYNVNDSLATIVDQKDRALEVSKAKVALFAAKSYVIPIKDTAARLDNCDSIRREAIYLAENVADYQKATDQLSDQNVELVYAQRDLIKTKDSLFSALRSSSKLLEETQHKCLKENEALQKKADRRFVIGPGVGATYWDNKITAVGGLFIVYRIGRL